MSNNHSSSSRLIVLPNLTVSKDLSSFIRPFAPANSACNFATSSSTSATSLSICSVAGEDLGLRAG